VKRAFDIGVAGIAVVITAPLMFAVLVHHAITRATILARTVRVGKHGSRFTQYSFAGLKQHVFLRNLPWLFNILAGDMSFIGPRAADPGDAVVAARGALAAAPGVICSWWLQQRGNVDFDDEATADREYAAAVTWRSDIGIALRAIPALIFSERRESAPRTVEILGIRIDNMSMVEALDWIRQRLGRDEHSVVCMTNAHSANLSCLNPAYHHSLLESGLNLADGVGIRLAGKLKRTPIRQNVNGTDLFPRLCAMLEGTTESVYLLGGRPGVAEAVAQWVGQRFHGTTIAGHHDGYFDPGQEREVIASIRRSGATVLLVAMGVPDQELWIHRNVEGTGVRVAIGVGGLFDFYSGRIPRAPAWMREIGLEWIYRLMQEPGRMWKRYLIGNWTFLARHILYELNFYHPRGQTTQP
jgi:N-acetylglucosaminyldiphosphoundecaprenol N-acetyl-beta-D-mannosaminyltransferase